MVNIILMCAIKSLFAHKLHDQKSSGRHGFQQDPDAFEPETQVRRAIPDGRNSPRNSNLRIPNL